MKLKKGEKAPDFCVKNQDGNLVKLSHFKGKKLILFFYPRDNTPGCTAEACNLKDNFKILKKEGFNILGISADNCISHKKFISKFDFPFNLLADTDKSMIKSYGVWGLKKFMGREFKGILRTTFIIDEKGMIKDVIEKVNTKNHTNQILKLYE